MSFLGRVALLTLVAGTASALAAASGHPGVASLVQSPRISIDAMNRPVEEVALELWEQSGTKVTVNFDAGPVVDVSVSDAPFWLALMALCESGGWGFSVNASPGYPVVVGPNPFDEKIEAYQVQGPAMLAWYGGEENRVAVLLDTRSSAFFIEPTLAPTFTVELEGGARKTIASPAEAQDGRGGRSWKLGALPKPIRALSVTLPVSGLTQVETVRIPYRADAEMLSSGVSTRFRRGKSRKTWERDRADFFNMIDGTAHEASFHIRRPEITELSEGALHAMGARVIDAAGNERVARVDRRGGEPGHGYGFEVHFFVPDGEAFEPAFLEIDIASGHRLVEVPFRLAGL